MAEPIRATIETAHVRRSPRYGVFLALGAALGILAALVLTFAFDATRDQSAATGVTYSTTQVFGFLALACVPVALALAAAIALILDLIVGRRTRDVRIAHERVRDVG